MKPLAHWAIHHQQRIRIAGRRGVEIHGELVGPEGVARHFVYDQPARRLTIDERGEPRTILLDDYGFESTQP